MEALLQFEQSHWQAGCRLVAGIDEAGRGPLAGPVVAAAVVLPADLTVLEPLRGLTDSKALSAKQRARFFPLIQEVALAYGVGIATAGLIDRVPDPRDRRRVIVHLTDTGRARMEAFVKRQADRIGIKLD